MGRENQSRGWRRAGLERGSLFDQDEGLKKDEGLMMEDQEGLSLKSSLLEGKGPEEVDSLLQEMFSKWKWDLLFFPSNNDVLSGI